jgi:translation initiation factor IF-1
VVRDVKMPSNSASAHASSPAEPNEPAWAVGKEELVYRVEFLGMTMGYARFTFKGKVAYNGKEVYHLNVRAWTSNFLSVIYPINDTIDYYLDVKTLAPLRQEYTSEVKRKDDIAFYDQEKGKIVYRYKRNGEIRKRVDVPPEVHDPVSAAFYFRTRDLGASDRPRQVYAGRKLWQISTRTLGLERIDTPGGQVDTVVIQPIITRDGNPENKGDMKMWMTNDARHVPVKIYAKFRKIRMWTLTADLVPPQEGG